MFTQHLLLQSTLPNGRPKISLLTLQADLKIKEGIIIYDCHSDSPYHLKRPQFHDDLEGGTYTINDIISLHSFLCNKVKETMAQELWEAFLITIHLTATKVVIVFLTHKKVIPAAGIWNSADAYSDCTWSIIKSIYPLTRDKDIALVQLYLSLSTWHTAITVINALDVEVIMFSMWHAKQGKFDISRDCICLTVMLIDEELYSIYYS
ncbi:hypothetical protein BDZ97DRAFT_1758557 [Flammula alnicola]|nr:hypothetical protein BDZ97DRAFT_1758557 [Flammula alnicola]